MNSEQFANAILISCYDPEGQKPSREEQLEARIYALVHRVERLEKELEEERKEVKVLRKTNKDLRDTIERLETWYGNLQQENYHYKDMYESLKGILNQKGF